MKKRTDKSGAEILEQISRESSEAEWKADELDEALREGGVNPDRLVKSVMSNVRRLVGRAADGAAPAPSQEPLPVLGVWKERTKLKPRAIADALGVTVTFISDVNRHVKDVPRRWLIALARRAEEALGVPEEVTLRAFDGPFQFARASSRDEAYEPQCPTCEELLRRSGLGEAEQQFWLGLLGEEGR